jgi:rhodanese-related sulfurtransferase
VQQFLEFVANHALLSGTFVLLLVAFVLNERARGGRALTPQEAVNLINREGAVVVDLREHREFEGGHIVDAINIPQSALDRRIAELDAYRERPLVLACRLGQHAGTAGTMLRKAGFARVNRLAGGMIEWRSQNLPVVKD